MGQGSSNIDASLTPLDGELSVPPRGPALTALLALTGVLFVIEGGRLIGRYVLALRRPAEITFSQSGIEVRGRTLMLGQLLREHVSVIPSGSLIRATREVRYPGLPMYAGLFALALGSYVGVGLIVDGARAASPSMLGTGLLIALLGLGLDFAFTSLLPGLAGRSRLVLVPRRGGILCLASVDPDKADRWLRQLAGAAPGPSAPSVRSAPVEATGRADRAADEPERESARNTP
ncbi:MAG TPA: hypothetical protein VJT73_19680 [Polyangiaceae bacterium]|nr:hypothetical protein [Polyangiaceae bacterium]